VEVDATGRRRKNTVSNTWGEAESYLYAYINEHASTHGFHTHQLFHVSGGNAKGFAEQAALCLASLVDMTKRQ
jgi:hypothetical protein